MGHGKYSSRWLYLTSPGWLHFRSQEQENASARDIISSPCGGNYVGGNRSREQDFLPLMILHLAPSLGILFSAPDVKDHESPLPTLFSTERKIMGSGGSSS